MAESTTQESPLDDDLYCFGCGADNPIGLKLTFYWDEHTGDYCTAYTPAREHQGWKGRLHGGLLSLVFDEVLSRVVLVQRGYSWVTAELSTRMIKPAIIGETLYFRARIESARSRLIVTVAEATLADGTVVATGQSKLMPVKG